ncbi:superoxide dismutase [Endozoicomonas montiporae]|uniref:Superoxide dismutase [Cu-Zn] n=2 Tax=Endozoicomonas montiporae TaxID=1027273 RepID=A0A081N4V7_9GAMM|nr:superoxide dismutase family protein [Endozoicomonas montiporae]AMO57647.1 superoxide dismutase [Endozoicomonas montiporae CL-33]KEQ13480.1 superoxide dismutase [Endozoicomonas montiporae]
MKITKIRLSLTLGASLLAAAILTGCSSDNSVQVVMNQVSPDGIGPEIGTITLEDVSGGLQFTPDLYDLVPGEHGFHVHENPSCDPGEKDGKMVAALAAGGHYDPDNTGRHAGPEGNGHRGDLPVLVVDDKGFAKSPVVARRLKLSEVKGRSLMIHAGGDNYSDNPPMGGGGARIACGVVK